MKKYILPAFILAILIILAGGYLMLPSFNVSADRAIIEEKDLYSVSESLGGKILADYESKKFVFDQEGKLVIYGNGWKNGAEYSEVVGGTELWLRDLESRKEFKLADDLVNWAVFQDDEYVLFNDDNKDIYQVNIETLAKKKIAEKVIFFDKPWQGRFLVGQKLNDDWQTGQYYEQAKGLVIVDIITSKISTLTEKWDDFAAFWSPNGGKIVFYSSNSAGLASLFIINPDGSGRTQLTNIDQMLFSEQTIPAISNRLIWSTDGQHIIYDSDYTIWHLQLNNSQDQLLKAEKVAYGIDPEWLIDGQSITVITSPKKGQRIIQTINID